MEARLEAKIDRDGCIGCGVCPDVCPSVFHMADDGKAEVYGGITEENVQVANQAAEQCPVSVIEIS